MFASLGSARADRIDLRRCARGSLTGAAVAFLLGGSAAADALKIGDLGPVPSRAACLENAETVLLRYIEEFGGLATTGDRTDPESWAIYGWSLRPGENDIVITCPTVANQVNAFYTVHSSGNEAAGNADLVAERIRELWSGRQ